MDPNEKFFRCVIQICKKDNRYAPDAYAFVRDGLFFTGKYLNKPEEGLERHVTGQELSDGMRAFALQEFGPMALRVLNTWGITKTNDFGEIVFSLIETGVLGKTDKDRKEDFADVYDFTQAFAKPYLPSSPASVTSRSPRKKPVRRRPSPEPPA